MWILIRWLRQEPADLDLQCFHIFLKTTGSAGQGLNLSEYSSASILCVCKTDSSVYLVLSTKVKSVAHLYFASLLIIRYIYFFKKKAVIS